MNTANQSRLREFSKGLSLEQPVEKQDDNGTVINLQKVVGEIPLDVENDSYLSIRRESERTVHNIALYPCKFIPELPRWAIRKYSKRDDTVLDPFVGSGTTFIECLNLGRNCLVIDYNPYL